MLVVPGGSGTMYHCLITSLFIRLAFARSSVFVGSSLSLCDAFTRDAGRTSPVCKAYKLSNTVMHYSRCAFAKNLKKNNKIKNCKKERVGICGYDEQEIGRGKSRDSLVYPGAVVR